MQPEVFTTPLRLRRKMPTAVLLGLFAILQLLIIGIAFLGGYILRDWRSGEPLIGTRFPLLSEAYNLLKDNAYFELPAEKKLEYGMIKGMLQAYNEPFTVFIEPPQHELQSQRLQGKYGGIGVRMERDTKNDVFLYPLPNSPAAIAGVRDGDKLIKVNDLVITSDLKNDEIQAAIRGPIGQKVKITVGHNPDYAPVELTVERAEVGLPSTSWNMVPNEPTIGIIHIHVIADTTPAEITKAIKNLQEQGAKSFILDVRNNGGGLVEAGVNMARLFLQKGVVIEQQYRGQPVKSYKVNTPGQFDDLPVVVLVNRGTASAAEIFAGALQGQKRAQVVGTRTYGKDTIQLVFSLSDGSSLHVTAAHWWIPGMPSRIGSKGLQPDLLLNDNADDRQLLQTAIQALDK